MRDFVYVSFLDNFAGLTINLCNPNHRLQPFEARKMRYKAVFVKTLMLRDPDLDRREREYCY